MWVGIGWVVGCVVDGALCVNVVFFRVLPLSLRIPPDVAKFPDFHFYIWMCFFWLRSIYKWIVKRFLLICNRNQNSEESSCKSIIRLQQCLRNWSRHASAEAQPNMQKANQHELQSQAFYVVHTLLNMFFNCVMFAALHLVNIIRICFCFACQYSLCIPAADPPWFITKINVTHIHVSFLFFECHGLIEKHCGHDRETLCVIRCR